MAVRMRARSERFLSRAAALRCIRFLALLMFGMGRSWDRFWTTCGPEKLEGSDDAINGAGVGSMPGIA
jgi:hypothetical protein